MPGTHALNTCGAHERRVRSLAIGRRVHPWRDNNVGVSLRERRDTTEVMLGVSLQARYDTTLVTTMQYLLVNRKKNINKYFCNVINLTNMLISPNY